MIKATLIMDKKKYKGEGKTIFDAISDIPLTYLEIKTKGVIKIEKGRKNAEKLFYMQPLRAIFANKLRRHAWAKNLETLIK